MERGLLRSSGHEDQKPWPLQAGAAREAAGLTGAVAARADAGSSRQRRRLCGGCSFASAKITHRAGGAVFDAAQRCRMLRRHPSSEERHCFDGVCSGVRIHSGSLVGPLQSAHPECFGRADQLSMRRAAQPTMRGSLGSCWRGERDAHSLACQILTASDIRLAPTRVKRTR